MLLKHHNAKGEITEKERKEHTDQILDEMNKS